MSVPFLLAMHGDLVIQGKRPDGDSIRFVPADSSQLDRLERADRIEVSQDGSVQLRFEAIDAPETHYGALAQPLGDAARDRLVALAGFSDVRYSDNGTVTASTPERVKATVLSKRAEANGRPVAYVLTGTDPALDDGTWVHVDAPLLHRTLNAALLDEGAPI